MPFCCSVAQCPTLFNPMVCSMPGFPVLHYLLEFAHAHVHRLSHAIQLRHPLSSPSPLAFDHSQHQGLFHWVGSLYRVVKVVKLQLQHFSLFNEYSGLISFRMDWLDLLAVQGTLKSLYPTPQFKSINWTLSLLHGPTLTSIHDYWKNRSFDYMDLCQQSDVSAF